MERFSGDELKGKANKGEMSAKNRSPVQGKKFQEGRFPRKVCTVHKPG